MSTQQHSSGPERLLSLDFFRGATMFLLIAEFTQLFSYLYDPSLEGQNNFTIIPGTGCGSGI